MKSIKCILIFTLVSIFGSEESKPAKDDLAIISEAMGHLIGKNLQVLGLTLDINALVRGMQDATLGKQSPMSEEDCMEALAVLQDESVEKSMKKNGEAADSFLKALQGKEGVISLLEGKLQYERVKEGSGEIVEPYSKPLIRYSGKYLNGPSIPLTEECVDLDETILGFKEGLVGMKEGEVRTLYVHPEFGFEKSSTLSANSLLIFEVEVIKADISSEIHEASQDMGL